VSRRDDRLALGWEAGELPLPEEGPIAVLRAGESEIYRLAGKDRFLLQQGDRPMHDRLAAQGLAVSPEVPAGAAAAIVVTTRFRGDALGAVAQALEIVPPGGIVAVTGARSDGIDATMRQIGAVLPIEGRMSKAHGRVFHLRRPEAIPEPVRGWAEDYALKPNAAGFTTGPGMFSPDHPDPGSERLAALVAGRLSGRVADLGAGWGWLAARILATNPEIEALDLHEAEARAVEAARLNVRDPRASFHWSDATRLSGSRYTWVVTNPPFHRGRAAEPGIGAAFIAAASRILLPAGRLTLVANRSLPYEAPLAAAFKSVETLAEDASYKVIEAGRPRRA
jgi:16S rRNA (guanine1207-N2)-methyltransferase